MITLDLIDALSPIIALIGAVLLYEWDHRRRARRLADFLRRYEGRQP